MSINNWISVISPVRFKDGHQHDVPVKQLQVYKINTKNCHLTVENLEERCECVQVLFTEQRVVANATLVTDTLCKRQKISTYLLSSSTPWAYLINHLRFTCLEVVVLVGPGRTLPVQEPEATLKDLSHASALALPDKVLVAALGAVGVVPVRNSWSCPVPDTAVSSSSTSPSAGHS